MNYYEAYAAYVAAKKELYKQQSGRQELEAQLELQLEEARELHMINSGAQKYFEDRMTMLESQKLGYFNAIEEEKERMMGRLGPRVDISADEYQAPEWFAIPESIEEIEALRETDPDQYEIFMAAVERINQAEKTAAGHREGASKASPAIRSPLEEYRAAKQALEKMDLEHAVSQAEQGYPESLDAMEKLASWENFPTDVLNKVESYTEHKKWMDGLIKDYNAGRVPGAKEAKAAAERLEQDVEKRTKKYNQVRRQADETLKKMSQKAAVSRDNYEESRTPYQSALDAQARRTDDMIKKANKNSRSLESAAEKVIPEVKKSIEDYDTLATAQAILYRGQKGKQLKSGCRAAGRQQGSECHSPGSGRQYREGDGKENIRSQNPS